LGKTKDLIPIFYARGYNPPYNEGKIAILRGIIKALSLKNIRSVVFNYKYKLNFQDTKSSIFKNDHVYEVKFEQSIPLISRETLFHKSGNLLNAYTSLMEILAIPKFLSVEKYIYKRGFCIVNMINCFSYPRIFAKFFFSSPVILHIYSRKIIANKTFKTLLNKVDKVIASSNSLAYFLEKKYNIDKMKIEVVYPPIDTELYKPVDKYESRKRLGMKIDSKILLYCGNIRSSRFPDYSMLFLLKKLVKKNPKIEFWIFAPENYENLKRKEDILSKASNINLGSSIKVTIKNLSDEEKVALYSASDLFILPFEPKEAVEPPLTVLEAMSCGLPIIANDITPIKNIAEEVDDWILPLNSMKKSCLKEQILSLLTDEEELIEPAKKIREFIVDNMSIDKAGHKLCEVFSTFSHKY
jgi:glycosyltransferase involved in cell wall biosynthesis